MAKYLNPFPCMRCAFTGKYGSSECTHADSFKRYDSNIQAHLDLERHHLSLNTGESLEVISSLGVRQYQVFRR